MQLAVIRWSGEQAPSASELRAALNAEPHAYSFWSNGAGDRYAAHSHSFDKLLTCLRGSITFILPATGAIVKLRAGDRLALPAGVRHEAVVGPAGVECAEAHLPRE